MHHNLVMAYESLPSFLTVTNRIQIWNIASRQPSKMLRIEYVASSSVLDMTIPYVFGSLNKVTDVAESTPAAAGWQSRERPACSAL